MDCRIKSGNDDVKNRSRDAIAPELCKRTARKLASKQKLAAEPDLRQMNPVVVTGFITVGPDAVVP